MNTATDGLSPTAYGTPGQMAELYRSIRRITEREPDSTFEDAEVEGEARELIGLIKGRLGAVS